MQKMWVHPNDVQRPSEVILEKLHGITTIVTENKKGNTMNKLERFLKEWDKDIGNRWGKLILLGDGDEQLKFGDAFLGITWRESVPIAIYDEAKVIQVYMDVDGMDYDEAVELFQFNTASAYFGKQTPIFIDSQW